MLKCKEYATVAVKRAQIYRLQEQGKIPKDEWSINKAQQDAQSKNDCSKSTNGGSLSRKIEEPAIGLTVLHCSFAQVVNEKELIMLDSDSTDTVLCDPKYVSNIQDSDNPLSINTNGGLVKSLQN